MAHQMQNQTQTIDEIHERQKSGETCVFTNGCFDILHAGHIHLLKKCRELGDFLVLGLNSDESIARIKGNNRPVIDQESRKAVLMAIRYVDYILLFNEDTPLNLIIEVKPDILVKGGDYNPDTVVGKDIVESYGGRVEIVPLLDGFSSTTIIDKINSVHGSDTIPTND
ncbi:D-glycero-beta-D-manno-heptose 1-phosphate adenylyltransferase [bacterium]|nr:D-glycero-beta-D-manno-heptose 1-phosphate adenylyltransferase [bacterium]MBU1024637.1 D-glycero-beta-D-manno-heptose 1-phosphate adenylyltransferase [bacterium]